MEKTNIYLMRDAPTGFYKIGRSYNPVVRERTLLAQAPAISLICYWVNRKSTDEALAHQMFGEKRERGEWFSLNDNDLVALYRGFWFSSRIDVVPLSHSLRARVIDATFGGASSYAFRQRKAQHRTN